MKKNLVLVIVAFALFMEGVDTTVINTAIPIMAHSLKVNPVDLKLALISYLLSLAIFIPISGWMADKFGQKKIFIWAMCIFTLSSIACGFSMNLTQLIVTRFIQGLGGALTIPVGRLIILRTWQRHEFINKTSLVVMIAAIGMMIGPVLGGIISTHCSWSWVFWVNGPFGLLTLLLAHYFLPEVPATPVPSLDKKGFVLFGGGLALFTYSLSAASESTAQTTHLILLLGASLVLLGLYAWHSRKQVHPIVKVALLETRTFRISVLANLFTRLSFGGTPFLLPFLFQIGLGFSPQISGLLLAPPALGVILVKPLSIHFLRYLGYKKLLTLNTILVGLIMCLFASIDSSTSVYCIALSTFAFGFLISLQYTGMNSLAYANIVAEDSSAAISIISTIQQLAQSFGVAFAALSIKFLSAHFSETSHLTLRVFHQAFLAMALITLCSTVIFLGLKKEDGRELIEIPTRTS